MLPILMIRPQIVTDMLAECERDSATGSLLVARAIMVSEAFVCTVLKRKGKLLCKTVCGFRFYHRGSVQDDRTNTFAFVHEIKRFIDIFQWHRMSNKVINLYLALHIPVNDFWNIGATACTTESGAAPRASGHQLEWTRGDFLPRASNTDNATLPPTFMATL